MSVTCKLSVFSSALSCAAAHSEKFHVGSLVHGNHRKTISFLNVPIPVHLHNALLLLCTVTTKALMNKVSSNIKVKSWCVFFCNFLRLTFHSCYLVMPFPYYLPEIVIFLLLLNL